MPAGNVPDGISHGEDRLTQGPRDPVQADTDFRKSSCQRGTAQPPKTSQKVPMNPARNLFGSGVMLRLFMHGGGIGRREKPENQMLELGGSVYDLSGRHRELF